MSDVVELARRVREQRFRIEVPGDPLPWPRAGAQIVASKGGKRIPGYVFRPWIRHYTPTKARARMDAIAAAWREAGFPTIAAGVPIEVACRFVFARPAGHFGTGRNAETVKPRYRGVRPGKGGNKNADGLRTGGDEDNLAKLAKDALSGVAYADDGQIARSTVEKLFVDQAGVEGPQSIIEIRALPADAPALEAAAA